MIKNCIIGFLSCYTVVLYIDLTNKCLAHKIMEWLKHEPKTITEKRLTKYVNIDTKLSKIIFNWLTKNETI